MSDEQLRKKIAEAMARGCKYSPQVGALVIHGAIEEIVRIAQQYAKELQTGNECKSC